ncbi:MAG: DUF6562 domain-containing protein [Muribaculaceae bacterium]
MKKGLIMVAAMSAVMFMSTSCSQDELMDTVADGQEITTTVTVSAPAAMSSRAASSVFGEETNYFSYLATSGTPSEGNLELNGHPLSFTVGIYYAKTDNGTTNYVLVDKQEKLSVADTEAYFNFRLIKGRKYRIVAYADYNATGKENLEAIPTTYNLNDELSDAFYVSEDFIADEHVGTMLRRPLGKLRLVCHDFKTFAMDSRFTLKNVEVTYKGQKMATVDELNALTGDYNYAAKADAEATTFLAKPAYYAGEFDATGMPLVDENGVQKQTAVFTMYLPANFGEEDQTGTYTPYEAGKPVPQSWMYPFEVKVTYLDENGAEQTITRQYNFDIPVKRNWLTTVDVENFWTDNTNIKVSVDPMFEGEINFTPAEIVVNTEQELRDAIDGIVSSTHSGTVKLGRNIDVAGDAIVLMPYNNNSVYINLDLNGHELSYVNPDNYTLFIVNAQSATLDCVLTIDDSSKAATGAVRMDRDECNHGEGGIAIQAQFGGKMVINGGRFISRDGTHPIYACDFLESIKDWGFKPSEIVINGGWFQDLDGLNDATEDGNIFGYDIYADILINIYNKYIGSTNNGFSVVHINGGTFVDYNPLNGDNMSGNTITEWNGTEWVKKEAKWVDDNHRVITAPYVDEKGNHTLYTVEPKDTPEYY